MKKPHSVSPVFRFGNGETVTIERQTARAQVSRVGAFFMVSGFALLVACSPKPVAEAPDGNTSAQAAEASEAPVAMDAAVAPKPVAPKVQARKEVSSESTAPKQEAAAGGSAASIAGGWVNAGGACDSGASVQFNPDGTYMSEGENGTWALNGKTLTVTTMATADAELASTQGPEQSTGEAGEKSVLTVLSITDDAAKVILANGSSANWTRCSG